MALPGRVAAVYIDVLRYEARRQADEQMRQPRELLHQEIEAALIFPANFFTSIIWLMDDRFCCCVRVI